MSMRLCLLGDAVGCCEITPFPDIFFILSDEPIVVTCAKISSTGMDSIWIGKLTSTGKRNPSAVPKAFKQENSFKWMHDK